MVTRLLNLLCLLVLAIVEVACSAAPSPPEQGRTSAPTTVDRPKMAAPAPPARTAAPRANVFPDFPWPPPPPSGLVMLPRGIFEGLADQKEVGNILTASLDRAGYAERSFYRAPNGFALVSRLEQITTDGSPARAKLRYIMPDATAPFSLDTYVASLFFAPKGRYRQIIFVVTDSSFATGKTELTPKAADTLLREGADRLPTGYKLMKFTQNHEVTALVYEFIKGENSHDVTVLIPSRIGIRDHLDRAGLGPLFGAASPR
jgi:hypothetical protein